jgi:hypothetical protein
MTTPPPEVEVQCLARCRTLTLHRLHAVLRGRPLYACSNACGAPLREISDATEKTPAARRREAEQLQRWLEDCKTAPRRALRTADDIKDPPKPKETTKPMPASNPMLDAIDAAVQTALEPLKKEINAALEDLKDTLKKAVKPEDLEKLVARLNDEHAEKNLPELVQRAMLQMLTTSRPTPTGAHGRRTRPTDTAPAPSGEEPAECKHKNHMRKCESCQRRHAAEADA